MRSIKNTFPTAWVAILTAATLGCADKPILGPESGSTISAMSGTEQDSADLRYIILFKSEVARPSHLVADLVAKHGGVAFHVWETALKGFAVTKLSPASLAILRAHPQVRSVEVDELNFPDDVQSLPSSLYGYQYARLWSLDRIDERQDQFNGQYEFDACGRGVHIYILDSGVRGGHSEFTGRIGTGVTRLMWSSGASPTIDQLGHGTQVAGAAAGSTFGVAKCAIVHSVRINDNGGAWTSDIIDGLNWVAANHQKPAVANLSYKSSHFSTRDALEGVIQSGVVMVKSAGNDSVDAFEDRSNRAAGLILAGAIDRSDYRSSFSNYGSLVTVFAPGSAIHTSDKDSNSDTTTVDGTSFAAPIVAGIAALLLEREPTATPSRVREVLINSATSDQVINPGAGSSNRIVYSRLTGMMTYGPRYVQSNVRKTVTWTALATGTYGTLAYQWEASVNGGTFTIVSTAQSYSRVVEEGETSTLQLRITATYSGGALLNVVDVVIEPPPLSANMSETPTTPEFSV